MGINSTTLFWGAGGDSFRIASVPKEGGSIATYGGALTVHYTLAVDDNDLYVAGTNTTTTGITRFPVPTPSTTPTPIPTTLSTSYPMIATEILMDSDYLYYSVYSESGTGLFKKPRAGGEAIRLVDEYTSNFALDQGNILYTINSISSGKDTLYQISKSGGFPTVLAECPSSGGAYFSSGIVADVRAIYLLTQISEGSNLILRYQKDYTEVVPP